MTEQEIMAKAVDEMMEIATAAAIATHSRSVPFKTAEMCEAAMARAVAMMVGEGGSEDRLNEGIRMTLKRWPDAVRIAHFNLYGRLTRS